MNIASRKSPLSGVATATQDTVEAVRRSSSRRVIFPFYDYESNNHQTRNKATSPQKNMDTSQDPKTVSLTVKQVDALLPPSPFVSKGSASRSQATGVAARPSPASSVTGAPATIPNMPSLLDPSDDTNQNANLSRAARSTPPPMALLSPIGRIQRYSSLSTSVYPSDVGAAKQVVLVSKGQEQHRGFSPLMAGKVVVPILRNPMKKAVQSKRHPDHAVKEHSTESIPSLASTSIDEDEDDLSTASFCMSSPSPEATDDETQEQNRVCFDPRIWVREFERCKDESESTWYSADEMDGFKREAIARVYEMQAASEQLVPTGTGRLVRRRMIATHKALFTNPALSMASDGDDDELIIQRLAKQEIRNVLVFDPHDICLKLFSKSIKRILPHVCVTCVRTSEDASRKIATAQRTKRGYDLIIVEERLKLFASTRSDGASLTGQDHHAASSGAAFIKSTSAMFNKELSSKVLFVGVTSHPEKHSSRMTECGADMVWPKPPPTFDKTMRDTLLKSILIKRGKGSTAKKYFV